MSFGDYIEEKIGEILGRLFGVLVVIIFLLFYGIDGFYIFILGSLMVGVDIIWLVGDYYKLKKRGEKILELVASLDEKYLIAEVIPKPRSIYTYPYYQAIKVACKNMNDKIGKLEKEILEYREYVESFAHEIKTLLAVLNLAITGKDNNSLVEELKKCDFYVEQMLYYARSDNPEKDYFIKEVVLSDIVQMVMVKFRDSILFSGIKIDIEDLEYVVYSDQKWLVFILSQVVQNAIKYSDKKERLLEIRGEEGVKQVVLKIKDKGCGISNGDLSRVFEKGFTGSKREKQHSTGMGLYLAKKLCLALGLKIELDSVEGEYTEVRIIFPRGEEYRFKEENVI